MNTSGKFLATLAVCLKPICCWSADLTDRYVSRVDSYQFEYPAGQLEIRRDYLCEGKRCTEFYVEDWTKDIRLGRKWDFRSLALERAAVGCLADGEGCSLDCTIRDSREIRSRHGVKGVEVDLRYHIRGPACGSIKLNPPTLDPVYVFDISRGGTYRILIFASRSDKSGDPGVSKKLMRDVLDTLTLIEK